MCVCVCVYNWIAKRWQSAGGRAKASCFTHQLILGVVQTILLFKKKEEEEEDQRRMGGGRRERKRESNQQQNIITRVQTPRECTVNHQEKKQQHIYIYIKGRAEEDECKTKRS